MEKKLNLNEKMVVESIRKKPKDLEALNTLKRLILRSQTTVKNIPTTSELLKAYHKLVLKHKIKKDLNLEQLLTKRAVRTLSGVTIITVLTKPFSCPGKCIYCPTENGMPKSYLSDEPAANRALGLKFDPYEQVRLRIKALEDNGHPTDKIELIVKGGTWNAYPTSYQYWFILRCFEACNESKTNDLQKAQIKNESARHRIIGLTLETRPDYINEKNIKIMRELGCTRVEMGVQTTDEKTLKKIQRGHDVKSVINATRLLKNSGFKVDYHLMPQLPGSTPAKDLKMMLEIFADSAFRPDMIKIYPCTVIKNTQLYKWLKAGKYKPYSDRQLINILKKFKTQVPRYARISRLIRDIPSHHIQAGNKLTNLRQVIQAEMTKEGLKCKCLRCREVGHQLKTIAAPKLFIDKYKSSGGTEYFISFEDAKRSVVFAFCRLRICKNVIYPAFIRELHTYGHLVEIGKTEKGASQHKGLGVKLVKIAEQLAKKGGVKKLTVISGVGVRGYYKKLGYKLDNTYMVKNI
ncbi:MAG: tRNA uridine(34) 5-carboxymethylaminomethyl modification radical SAM/GNAT enzyme Elp3 [Patescibacteria group bacterium]